MRKGFIPPCPDPDKYILIETKEGYYWRRKRGTVKPAKLNDVLAQNAMNSKVASPAAKRIILKLQPFLDYLKTGRIAAELAGRLIKAMSRNGCADFSMMKGLEFQSHTLSKLLRQSVSVKEHHGEVIISFWISDYTVPKLGQYVTGFYFEAILLYGDATVDNGLRVDSDVSRLYLFEEKKESLFCKLNLQLPERSTSWMVILKVSCQEPKKMSTSARHYGMKVVEVG